MLENTNIASDQIEDQEENKRLAVIVLAGIATAVLLGIFVTGMLKLGMANNKIDSLMAQVKTLQSENESLKAEIDSMQAEIDTRDEEIAIYRDSIEEISQISDEINTCISNIKGILHGEATD